MYYKEREMAADNKALGKFDLVGIPPSQRGVPQIEVTFDIDANGIVSVHAKDMGTGKEQSIKITANQKLDKGEIEKMQKDAENYAEEDKKKKEAAETKNEAEALVYTIEKAVKDAGSKVDKTQLADIERDKNELKDLIKNNETGMLKRKMEDVNKKLHEMSAKLYQEAMKQEEKAKDHEVGGKKKDKVVDVRFQGQGCAISKAASSLLTGWVKGKTKEVLKNMTNDR